MVNNKKQLNELTPTLFVSLGGSGLEIMSRLRSGLLAHNWGEMSNPHRLESLSDFPLAEFMHFDLDQGAVWGGNKNSEIDPFSSLVAFSKSERISNPISIPEYFENSNGLEEYPHIARWFPVDTCWVERMNLDHGAAQVRAISRLCFFDKIDEIESMLRQKLRRMHSLSTNQRQTLNKLNISVGNYAKVVVVCSLSGGTGAGSFLDMGWLARQVMQEIYGLANVQLVALLPTGFSRFNVARCKANAYAALMELDSAMRGEFADKYIGRWRKDTPELPLPDKPFDEVNLIDTAGHVPRVSTESVQHDYQMIADVLLEELSDTEFRWAIYSNCWNSRKMYALRDFAMEVVDPRFEELHFLYPMPYSSFGFARIDVMLQEHFALIKNAWAVDILRTLISMVNKNEVIDRSGNAVNCETSFEGYGGMINDDLLSGVETGREIVEQIISGLEAESKFIEAQLTKQQPILLPIKIKALEVTKCEQEVICALVNLVLADQGSPTEVFLKLHDSASKEGLITKIRTVAAAEVAKHYDERVQGDPLFFALNEMKDKNPTELERLFNTLIVRAMPRVELGSVGSSWRPDKEQFRLFMSVSDITEFEQKFGSILSKANNTGVRLVLCHASQTGRLQCYSDLYGFPVGAIAELESWYGHYIDENLKVRRGAVLPLHNVKDPSLFIHPRFLGVNNLHVLADDFKLFQLSIILGVLSRVYDLILSSGGIYKFLFEMGVWRRLISEPVLRQEGLNVDDNARNLLVQQVNCLTASLNTVQQLAVLVLITYFKEKVYPRPLIKQSNGGQTPQNTFPYYCFLEMENEWKERVTSDPDFPVSDEEISNTLRLARADWNGFIRGWTEEVEGSENDCYPHEVRAVNADDDTEQNRATGNFVPVFLPKRSVTKLFFKDPDALVDKLKDYLPSSLKPKPSKVTAPTHEQGVIGTGLAVPPPLPKLELPSYFAVIAGQQAGPFNVAQLAAMVQAGQMNQATLCWKNGLSSWLPAKSITELNILWDDLPPTRLLN